MKGIRALSPAQPGCLATKGRTMDLLQWLATTEDWSHHSELHQRLRSHPSFALLIPSQNVHNPGFYTRPGPDDGRDLVAFTSQDEAHRYAESRLNTTTQTLTVDGGRLFRSPAVLGLSGLALNPDAPLWARRFSAEECGRIGALCVLRSPPLLDLLPCRSVAEAHLYMDMEGCEALPRQQRLEQWGNLLVSVYECRRRGAPCTYTFVAPDDPLAREGYGGAEPSQLIRPARFVEWARHMLSVSPNPVRDESERRLARSALTTARNCCIEARKFVAEGGFATPNYPDSQPIPLAELVQLQGEAESRLEAL